MIRKNLLFAVFVLFSFSILGCSLFYNHTLRQQTFQNNTLQNHMGDLRFQFKDFEEMPLPQHPAEVEKNKEAIATDYPTPKKQSPSRISNNETQVGAQQPFAPEEAGSLRSQIEQKYISRLQSLASSYEGKLNGLISGAMNEFNASKKANPNADIGPLVNKYYSAGKSLEAECDSQFYSVLGAFENELKANSLPLDAAAKARETYEARKSARAGQLLSEK